MESYIEEQPENAPLGVGIYCTSFQVQAENSDLTKHPQCVYIRPRASNVASLVAYPIRQPSQLR